VNGSAEMMSGSKRDGRLIVYVSKRRRAAGCVERIMQAAKAEDRTVSDFILRTCEQHLELDAWSRGVAGGLPHRAA